MQEKMTLRQSGSFNPQKIPAGDGPFFRTQTEDNALIRRRIFQLLSIIEPILLNDENVIKALNNGMVETISDMLIF
jgi:hypothetical protein